MAVADTANGRGTPLLDVEGVSKRYGGIQAVAEGNLRVGRGELVGLVGPNGCGKSTMLNIVSGQVMPDGGTVLLDGEPLPLGKYRATQDRGVLIVAQELALAPLDTVWESIVLGAEPLNRGIINRRKARQIAKDALALLGHELPLNASVSSLTGVERRLVTIARGAAHPHVRLLILDEPTAGLPHHEADRVVEAMRRLVGEERSVILVSHHIDEVVAACGRVTLMRDGRTVQNLEGEEVTKDAIVSMLLAGTSTEPLERKPRQLGETVASLDGVHGRALKGVSLEVRRGEVVGIAGILGSGATEVMELLSGQAQPSKGTVTVGVSGDRPASPHTTIGKKVGYVTGDRSSLVFRTMSVEEHVALPGLSRFSMSGFISRRKQRKWVKSSLDALSVKGSPGDPMTSLSGGNQQRALMARWVKDERAELLVVHEPTVGVDIAGRRQLLELLRELAATRGVIVAAEPDELAAVCDRVICLRRGLIAAEFEVDQTGAEDRILSTIAFGGRMSG
jgi:ABC-type sugar transport system ATPase subunit